MLRSISNYNESLCLRLGYVIRTCVSVFFRKKALLLSISALFVSGAVNPIYAHQPVAFTHKVQPIELVERVVPEPIDLQSIRLEDELREQEGGPYRFAIPRTVLITPDVNGMWEEIDNETWLWRIHITSPGARSISLGFTHYFMPPGGNLFIYTTDHSQVLGPFTENDNEGHSQLWTPLIHSDDIVVELTIPASEVSQLEMELTSINHGYRGFNPLLIDKGLGDSDYCHVNVACPEGEPWRDQIRSVARYHVTRSDGSYWCTGVLINNTIGNDKNYFLTAFHCFDEWDDGILGDPVNVAASMVVYWNFEASDCNGTTGPENENQSGAVFRAAYEPSDFTLVELDDTPSSVFDVYYAGWDRSSVAPSSGAAVHHPQGDLKKISIEDQSLSVTSYGGYSSPGDGTHLRVADWDVGSTEAGSSGCPFFNQDKKVVGTLHGGSAECGNNESDWLGRFYKSWTGGGTSSTRLSNCLDPLSTSITAISGKDPGFEDTFPVTTLNSLKWTDTYGTPTVDELANNEPSSPYSLHLEYTDEVQSRAINLSGFPSAELVYYWQRYSTEYGDDLYVDYWDGSSWQQLKTHFRNEGSTSVFTKEVVELPIGALHAGFRVRFQASCGDTYDEWYIDDVSIKGTGGAGLQCTNTITSYPYQEGFESDLGDWNNIINHLGDDLDWIRHTGSTPFPACEGAYCLYSETSGYDNKTAVLEGPCFDLSSLSSPLLKFCYHMYGSDIGTLSVKISDNGSWTAPPIWSLSGYQGNVWHSAFVDLSAYSGTTVKIRFNNLVGSDYTAIDNIVVDESTSLCGDTTIGAGTSYLLWPMYTGNKKSRTQVIYLSNEILMSGTITALALDVGAWPGQTMNNWTIRMKHTSMDYYSEPSFETGWRTVYQVDEPAGNSGWHTFVFSTPFEYNGTDNLMVDFSLNNSSTSTPGSCRATDSGTVRTAIKSSDSGDPLDWTGSASGTSNVPNIKLTICGGNYIPQLSNGVVSPTSGDPDTDFYWYVDYYDADGDSPSTKDVIIDDSVAYTMGLFSGSPSNGTYRYGPLKLDESSHSYYFNFEDGNGGSTRLPSSGTYPGPSVAIIGDLNNNGKVDFVDFSILASQWFQSPGSPSADIAPESGDGLVDYLDLAEIAEHWLAGVE